MISIVLGHLSSLLPPLVLVQVMLCPQLYYLSSVVLVCLCVVFPRILHVVHCVGFGQLAFFLHVQTIGVFVERLCLAELFGYLMTVLCHHFLFSAVLKSLRSSAASSFLL